VQWLTLLRDLLRSNGIPNGYTYAGVGDFLLRHGVWYEPRPLPKSIRHGAPRQCFANAVMLGRIKGLRYVEGYALAQFKGDALLPVQHGWNLDRDGNLIDATWREPGLAYLGVEFSVGRAENALWFDDASVLDNPKSRYRIFKEPWLGENFNLAWRRSNKLRRAASELRAAGIWRD